ncbi:hypothetical protein QBC44DRAFT_322802 [Cladorrhinum sp. PSN332]|nr:hypothetical protein QBC44DRAFT_322802 [Cladorrhinum sp. PSN332]
MLWLVLLVLVLLLSSKLAEEEGRGNSLPLSLPSYTSQRLYLLHTLATQLTLTLALIIQSEQSLTFAPHNRFTRSVHPYHHIRS